MLDCFEQKSLDLALITETWLQNNADTLETRAELEGNYSLSMIARNRSTAVSNGRRYGGVGIIYKKSTISILEFKLAHPESYEVVGAIAKIHGVPWVLPTPQYHPLRAKQNLEFLYDVINEAKRLHENCGVIFAGDFNQWPAQDLIDEHPDLVEVEHGRTRNGRAIDRTFVKFRRSLTAYGTSKPLDTEGGSDSDHRVAWARAAFSRPENNSLKYSYL